MTSQYLHNGAGDLTGPTLQQSVFAGTVSPRDIVAVREIKHDASGTDTALFSGPALNYTVAVNGDTVTVTDTTGVDGVDTLRNVEQLRFSDDTVPVLEPSAPVILAVVVGDSSATVSFSAGAAQGGAIKEFKVQALVGGSVARTVKGIPASATSAHVDGLDNGTTYKFKVVAVNKIGLDSEPSAPSAPVVPKPPAPSVAHSTPSGGQTDFGVSGNLTVTFDSSVTSTDFADATTLRNNVTSSSLDAAVSYDDATHTLTVDPNADLTQGTSYTLTLSGTHESGIRDSFGTPMSTTAITFTTARDLSAPTVTSVSPARGSTGVGRGANLVVRFSEQVKGIQPVSVVLTNRKTGAIVRTVLKLSSDGTRLTIDPRAKLARNTGYRLTVMGGSAAIRDSSDNPLVTFTTQFRVRP